MGRVLESDTGDPLPFANILIDSLGTGAATNIDGEYRIERIPAGTYSVSYSYTGFNRKTVTGVEITSGETTTLDVSLEYSALELGTVTVSAERERGSTAEVLNERKVAASVMDVLDVQQISAAGGSAANAIERASGAEVTEGKYVQVRGFGGRYGKVTINGVPVPAISADEKSVSLDVVSSDVLQSATVTKGWTPDLPADFAGGLVDLRTIDTPSSFRMSFKSKAKYNSVTSFQEGLTIGDCDDIWTGFSNCYAWPASVAGMPDSVGVTGEVVFSGPRSSAHYQYLVLNDDELGALGADVAGMMPIGPSERTLPLGKSFELSLGDRFQLLGRQFGFLGVGSYSNSFQQFRDAEFNSPDLDPIFGEVQETEQTVRVGALGVLSFEPATAQRLSATIIFNRLTEDLSRFQAGIFDPFGEQATARTFTNQRVSSTLVSMQLQGEHQLVSRSTAKWTTAYSTTNRLEPGTMPVQYQGPGGLVPDGNLLTDFNLPDSLITTASITKKLDAPSRNHFDQVDRAYMGKFDLTIPFRVRGRRVTFKTGVYADLAERVQDGHRVIFLAAGDIGERLPDLVFTRENMAGDFVPFLAFPTETGVYVDEGTQEGDNFEARQDVTAAYAMLDLEPIAGLRIIGGARLSRNKQIVDLIPKYNGGSIAPENLPAGASYSITRSFEDLLPSLSFQYAFSEEADFRAGYGRTVGRPQFRELVPFVFEPRPGAPSIGGNPELERTLIDNFDIRFSWYPVPSSLFSLGGFFKHFDGPVEPLSGTGGSYINTGKANTYGAEGEVRLPFLLLSSRLTNWGMRLNMTMLQTKAGEFFFIQLPDAPGGPTRSIFLPAGNRPLFGQTPILFNAGLTYESGGGRTSGTVLYRYTGEQLRYLGSQGLRTFREPSSTLDLILSRRFFTNWTLGLELRNLIGTETTYLTEIPGLETVIVNHVVRNRIVPGGDPVIQEFHDRGRTVEVGLSWSLN